MALNKTIKLNTFKVIWKKQITYFFLSILIFGTLQSFIGYLSNKGYISYHKHPVTDAIRDQINLTFKLLLLVDVAFLAPIIEELSFRGFLTKNKRLISISISFLLGTLITFGLMSLGIMDDFPVRTQVIVFFISSGVFLITSKTKVGIRFTGFNRNQKYKLLLITSLVFGFLHLGENGADNSLIAIGLIILPYFALGFIYGVMRINHGLMQSIYLHILFNSFVCFLNLIK